MGIPSFYRHLCKRFPRIIVPGAGGAVEWLCLDFNCAMYYVLRRMPPVSSASSVAAWEREFCEEIAAYMREIVAVAGPTRGVYVSCDGVVCAAKRRQQRLRRFKGPWQAEAEAAVRRAAGATAPSAGGERSSGWDQNALTPGSAFMARLGDVLTAAGKGLGASRGLEVIISTTAEAGEGEHKLLRHMRLVRPVSCAIYGLDADLILLSMLLTAETGSAVRLLREAQEFEREAGAAEWRSLDVGELMDALLESREPRRVRDYVAAMSLLGNDFLPRSLTHTVRDDGIPMLLRALQERLWSAGRWLVGEDGLISRSALCALLEPWAADEDNSMLGAVKDAARAARYPPGIGENPEETALREWSSQPTRWATLTRLFGTGGHGLRPDWRDIYKRRWGAGGAAAYLEGVAWVWDYYSGRAVCQGWTFDEHLPPLWSDVVGALRHSDGASDQLTAPPVKYPEPLPEWLHLLAVLPVDSVRALLPAAAQRVVALAPEYWPTGWSLFDVGRRQIWECEPLIPMIPEGLLRSWIPVAKK
jgi:5'-3' exonuclease